MQGFTENRCLRWMNALLKYCNCNNNYIFHQVNSITPDPPLISTFPSCFFSITAIVQIVFTDYIESITRDKLQQHWPPIFKLISHDTRYWISDACCVLGTGVSMASLLVYKNIILLLLHITIHRKCMGKVHNLIVS